MAHGRGAAQAERFVANGKNEESNGIVKVCGRNLRAVENAQKKRRRVRQRLPQAGDDRKIIILDKRA